MHNGAASEYEIGQLRLSALLTGTAVPKAMFVEPDGYGRVVRLGDIVGRRDARRVIAIGAGRVRLESLLPADCRRTPAVIEVSLGST